MSPHIPIWRRLAGPTLGALAVVAMAPSSAAAAKPKVLVLPYQHLNKGMPEDLGEQTTVVVAREMSAQGVNVIRADDVGGASAPAPEQTADPNAPTGDPKAQAKAEKFLERARSSMDDSEFERAAKLLQRAAKLMEKNADAVPDLRLLSEIYLQGGIAFFRDGMEDEGDDMLNKAVHLDPDRTLDAADYPPIFIRVYDRARFNVLRRPRARIEVKAKAGATVLLDGRNMGKAPIVLEDALPGKHWIRVERAGESVQVKTVRARGKKTLEVEFAGGGADAGPSAAPAAGVLGAISANKVESEHIAALAKAGRKAGADFVLFGGIYKTDTAYQIRTAYVQVRSGTVGGLTDIAFDLDMLSAEIEVFKLVDDAKTQAESGALKNPDEAPYVLAKKMRQPRRRRVVGTGAKETKLSKAVAAPPPIKPPRAPKMQDPDTGRAPMAKAPAATRGAGRVKRPVDRAPTLVPKDEVPTAKAKPPTSTALTAGAIIPKDEQDDDDDGSLWWVWVIAGVAAAGAATAGGILLAGNSGSDQGSLQITW